MSYRPTECSSPIGRPATLGSRSQRIGPTSAGIDDLDDLVDEDLKRRIAAQQINLPTLVAQVRHRGYTPGPVFEMTEGRKEVAGGCSRSPACRDAAL